MNAVLIVLVVLAVVIVAGLLLSSPLLNKKQDAAIAHVKAALGAGNVKVIEPKTTGMGSDPEEAGGLRGMGVLAVTDTDLMFSTWAGPKDWRVARSDITSIDTDHADPATAHKLTITVGYAGPDGPATAMFRLGEPVPWLIELGYDWGPEGPPALEDDDADEDGDEDGDESEA